MNITVDDIIKFILIGGGLLISASIHESAHGLVAYWFGDDTAKEQGRISLNPLVHIDLFMTILLPLMLILGSGGKMVFGGAKPTPVNTNNMRHPVMGEIACTLAGPISNLLQAAAALGILAYLTREHGTTICRPDSYNAYFFISFFMTNIILAMFNLVPVPPLDGSHVLKYMLPREFMAFFEMPFYTALFVMIIFSAVGLFQPVANFSLRVCSTLLLTFVDSSYWEAYIY